MTFNNLSCYTSKANIILNRYLRNSLCLHQNKIEAYFNVIINKMSWKNSSCYSLLSKSDIFAVLRPHLDFTRTICDLEMWSTHSPTYNILHYKRCLQSVFSSAHRECALNQLSKHLQSNNKLQSRFPVDIKQTNGRKSKPWRYLLTKLLPHRFIAHIETNTCNLETRLTRTSSTT